MKQSGGTTVRNRQWFLSVVPPDCLVAINKTGLNVDVTTVTSNVLGVSKTYGSEFNVAYLFFVINIFEKMFVMGDDSS